MIQLTYQPALDTFHAVFRFLRLRDVLYECGKVHRDHLRIIDFYFLFPFRVEEIRLAPTHRRFKKLASAYAHTKPYGEQPSSDLIFERMKPMQIAALETLASHSFLEREVFQIGDIRFTDKAVPEEIVGRIKELNNDQSNLMEFITVLANDYELFGSNGLKARSGLLEYRYDAA